MSWILLLWLYFLKYLIRNIYKDTIYTTYVHTVGPLCSGSPYLQIHWLATVYLKTHYQYSGYCPNHSQTLAKWGLQGLETLHAGFQMRPNMSTLCLLISVFILLKKKKKGPFHHLVECSSHFCAFYWWSCCFKWFPSIVLKCCLGFLNARSS